jgi:PAS domain S-box-containing protein
MFACDEHRTVKRVNKSFERLFGCSADQIVGQPGASLQADPAAWSDQLTASVGAEPTASTLDVIRANGEIVTVRFHALPVLDSAGDVLGFVNVLNSLDEASSDVELLKARERTASVNKAKTAFLETVSHELRTPMNGILGMLELLNDASLPEEEARLVRMAFGSASALLTVLNDILDATKLASGSLKVEKRRFDAASLLAEKVESLRPQLSAKNLTLAMKTENVRSINMVGDPTRLSQVTSNLIRNAIKYTEEGGVTVTLAVRSLDAADFLRVEVNDTGCGIPEEALPDVFDRFGRIRDGDRANGGGLGLGLSLSHELVEAMGGRIGVNSQFGRGSTF